MYSLRLNMVTYHLKLDFVRQLVLALEGSALMGLHNVFIVPVNSYSNML